MQWRNTPFRYGAVAGFLHWLVVALILVQFGLALYAETLGLGLEKLATLARHKSVGITIFGLAVLRLCWRRWSPPPPLPASMPRWEHMAARSSHILLYALLLVLPLTGWLMSSAAGFSVSWFGLFALPDLIPADPLWQGRLESVHETLAWSLAALALLHALAALRHHFVLRDQVLLRMLPGWKRR